LEGLAAELIAAAEAEFRLNRPRDDGRTPKQLGQVNDLIAPVELSYLLDVFSEIRRGTEGTMTLRDIVAWAQISGIDLDAFSAGIILRIDRAFVRVQGEPIIEAPKSLIEKMQMMKQHEVNLRSGIRVASVNPQKRKP
jgi:hypothetical protein